MIEKIIFDYLKSVLDEDVHLERVPGSNLPFVLFERTGSRVYNHTTTALFAFQSYADSMFKAAELNEKLKNALNDMPNHTGISKAKLNSDYNYTNTQTNEYRYQAVFEITYIGG